MMKKKVAIVQSNYIPWKGYFDLIKSVDEFILYDDVQYTRRDWRNRNKIKTPQGLQWLTVPVQVKGKYDQTVYETLIDGDDWAENHWKAFQQNYKKSKYFEEISFLMSPIFLGAKPDRLSHLNKALIELVCGYLGITTRIRFSNEFVLVEDRNERLAKICEQCQAGTYVSGPAAKSYLTTEPFSTRNIQVEWFDYSGYPEYTQLWGQFEHTVSIVDLLFNCGPSSLNFMRKS